MAIPCLRSLPFSFPLLALVAVFGAAPMCGQNEHQISGTEQFGLFVSSSDRNEVCGANIDVTGRAKDRSAYEPSNLGVRQLQALHAQVQHNFCQRSFDRTVVRFTLIAGGEVVRRITIDSEDGIPREEFADPGLLRNPSAENLDTSGLWSQTFLDHIFYGRFDRMRSEDIGRGQFAWLYYEFISQYGQKYERFLTPPLQEYTVTVDITRGGVTTRSSSTYVMEKRVLPSFQKNEDDRSGIFGKHHADIDALLQRHAGNSRAIKQLYENFYRYANYQPPIQDTPDEAAALFGVQPEPSASSPTVAERSPLSKAVERYLRARLQFAVPDDALAETSDFVATRFEALGLRGEARDGWLSGAGDEQTFNLQAASRFLYGSAVPRATQDAVRLFRDDVQAHDPLLISAACAFCDGRSTDERPAGFPARFLSERPNGPGALSNEMLWDPARLVDMHHAEADIRDKWRKEMGASASGQILRCEYLPADGSMTSRVVRSYWYHSAPADWSRTSADLSPNHPLVADVGAPANGCPDRLPQ